MDAIEALDRYHSEALQAIRGAGSSADLEAARIEFLGRKKGRLRDLQTLVGKAAPDQRPLVGKRFNEVKTEVEAALEARKAELDRPRTVQTGLDITLPGTPLELGRRHPLTQTMDEFKDIMGRFGFTVADGPEIEDERHNFEALNIPPEHPARDPLDNFYLATATLSPPWQGGAGGGQRDQGPLLLRSQTSTVQIRVMERTPPPVRIVSLGRVYRPDTIDATHSCMFHQMEGLMVERGVTMAQLKTVLRLFARAYLGESVGIRFRPSFFPFTEPSVEVDIEWGGGWMEIGGAGMVDPNVLEAVGYDPEQVSGFAFGLGIERFCMKRHNITDIRRFYENDLRFLRQF
ncbi:MAG: phenylalanine--tRNA ligase subunit alpha [Planctomycetes bacterium]|nr:phenylalanine--tRNA ligase subunit alpha [Planctomycetota bacterium]